jgi:Cu-Zn family superoxide dismutase
MRAVAALVVLGALMLGGCNDGLRAGDAHWPTSAVCVLAGTEGNEQVAGTVTFRREGRGVLIEAFVTGLTPGEHGFHVHEFGDVNCADGTCTGGHFNPAGVDHGGPDDAVRHVGDLGNLMADETGTARYVRHDHLVSLDMSDPSCIIGRAIIVHAAPDDLVSQPTGAAGARVAAGVIGVGKE